MKFNIYSCKEENIDLCPTCYRKSSTLFPYVVFTKINDPQSRSTYTKKFTDWFQILTQLQCDGCKKSFYDIFLRDDIVVNPVQRQSCPINFVTHKVSSSGRINKKDDYVDHTYMVNESSGRKNRSGNMIDMTLMVHESAGNARNNFSSALDKFFAPLSK
jgi:hypothetical protein